MDFVKLEWVPPGCILAAPEAILQNHHRCDAHGNHPYRKRMAKSLKNANPCLMVEAYI